MTRPLATVHYLRTARRCTEMPDRYGEPDDPNKHECQDGWVGPDGRDADNPQPCVVCKPHLAPEVLRADLERQTSGPPDPDWSGRRAQHGGR